jgi:hypothetical protein
MVRKYKRIIDSVTVDSEQTHSTSRLSTSISSIHPSSSSPVPSSRTATPSILSPTDLSFEWIDKDRRPHAFSTELSMENGLQIKKLKCFEVEGIVMDYYLREEAHAHTIQVQLDTSDIDHIKSIVRTAPRHVEAGYRWPFDGNIAKFTSKDSKDKLTRDFEPILDGRGIQDLKNYTGNLGDLTVDDVMEGLKVSIEYSPVPYGGKKSRGNDDGFPPGCTFKLYSITILGMTDRPMLDVSSPSKRRKLNYS